MIRLGDFNEYVHSNFISLLIMNEEKKSLMSAVIVYVSLSPRSAIFAV